MALLNTIRGSADLRRLPPADVLALADEIREFLVQTVSRTGGHLGPNLGVVELTIALHRVFESPHDRILWDTGHQAYVHKLLTGRAAGFDRLRKRGGLSGYPSQTESEHDVIENSHASTALSYADGIAKAYALTGEADRSVVVVVGDGALTGGMAWEAVNNIAAAEDRPVIIVVNDNGRSYAPTVGGVADLLSAMRTAAPYERFLAWGKNSVRHTPGIGRPLYNLVHAVKAGFKDLFAPQALFEGLGLKYLGPVDGHDVTAVEAALRRARRFGGPVLVHCVTEKGRGYVPAETDEQDKMHVFRQIDPVTGASIPSTTPTWTEVFGAELPALAAERPELVAITAAMLEPTGLEPMHEKFPDRVFDVGIAEQHAVTSAAGLAMGGMHPVVCLYATFLNRAFDQLLMDVALHECPVTFVLDRAGVTGTDGPSHNGMWDLSILQVVPGLRIAAPRDAATLRLALREAVDVDGPTAIRFPKGTPGVDLPALSQVAGLDVLRVGEPEDVLLVCVGALAGLGLQVADELATEALGVTVVDPRWVLPVNPELARMGGRHRLVVTLEDGGRVGGVGAAVTLSLRDQRVATPVHVIGLPQRFLEQGTRAEVLADCGLTALEIADQIRGLLTTERNPL
ncbi:1-deoxy-D-xylulose-5-phosphate synthase [Actinoallomurus bryophytorum]|uniref:1-deoxy-D-xylulose-5-phosphate synthase n=1 Tax=Actinoallomurus bryophytorum TaxID=1490222 RepID=A0A543CIY1_9ACTN|nr:1-deoxy-D-xylulose-5-phosphate synthase [Actinoallomurus bryophytorum]TQL97051.1 1-deoxy-D-xylulose-5-phosphate synthase [Actinoallomurus bryophytorum]